MADKSLADKMLIWQRLVEGTKLRAGEFPFLAAQLAELAELLARVQEQLRLQGVYEGKLREATRVRQEAEAQADELTGRVIGALKSVYGRYSPVLEEFGIRPNTPPGPKGGRREKPPAPDEGETGA